jgi:hypothetical protein
LSPKVYVDLTYYDEIRKEIERVENSLKSKKDPTLELVTTKDIAWHQDKFSFDQTKFDFLFFVVLNTTGIEEHKLQIGHAPAATKFGSSASGNFTPKVLNDSNIEILQDIESQQGAGYLINQSYDGKTFVHKRTGYRCIITNGFAVQKANGLNCINYNYSRPGREVLIVRVKNLKFS